MAKRANGAGSLRQREHSWEARATLPPDADGRRVRLSASAPTPRAAQAALAAKVVAVLAGRPATASTQRLRAYLPAWLATRPLRPSTAALYAHVLTTYLLPALGDAALGRLTPAGVHTALAGLPCGARTRQVAYQVLHAALAQAVRWELVPRNVAALVTRPAAPPPPRATWDAGQARAFLAATASTRWGPLWTLALYTGLRQGELLALRWVDVGPAALQVTGTLGRDGTRGPPKTPGSARTVPLAPAALTALREVRAWQAAQGCPTAAYCFTTRAGTPIRAGNGNVLRTFQAAVTRAGLPCIPFHGLRHVALTLLALGTPLPTVQALAGHTDLATTARYLHMPPPEHCAAVARLAALLGDAGPVEGVWREVGPAG